MIRSNFHLQPRRRLSIDRECYRSALMSIAAKIPQFGSFLSFRFGMFSFPAPHCPMGFWTGTSPFVPHRVIVTVEGAEEGMMYQFPSEGRQTARSVFWSPS